jgi:DNA polymerase-3 subunit epsilon
MRGSGRRHFFGGAGCRAVLRWGVLIGECQFTAIDFESAGAARGRTDVPVQVGLARWSPGAGHGGSFVSYLASDAPIQWSARKVHGIRDEDLAGAPGLLGLWPEIKRHLAGAVVVAHGKGTEKRFLRAFPGHGFGPWVDTLLLARAAWPELGDHSLSALCEVRGLSGKVAAMVPGRRWHDALYDAAASLVLLEELVEVFDLGEKPVEWLVMPDTRAWHRSRRGV